MIIWFMKENLGNLEYWMLDGVGHAPFWESEEEVSGIMRAWCAKVMEEREGRGLGDKESIVTEPRSILL